MNGGIVFLITVIAVFACIIAAVELWDRKEDERYRRLLKDSVRCAGKISDIKRRGLLDGGSAYQWQVLVDFQYEGRGYRITQACTSRPSGSIDDHVTVLVDTSDPNQSVAAIE